MNDTAEKIYVDPQMAEILREMAEADLPPLSSLSIEAARAQVEEAIWSGTWTRPRCRPDRPHDARPCGPDRAAPLPPSDAASLPLVIYLHGGGLACARSTPTTA